MESVRVDESLIVTVTQRTTVDSPLHQSVVLCATAGCKSDRHTATVGGTEWTRSWTGRGVATGWTGVVVVHPPHLCRGVFLAFWD